MKSWSNWADLSDHNVGSVNKHAKGVYAIRKTTNVQPTESDIIYIGTSGKGSQGVGTRLANLLKGLRETNDKKASDYHSASLKIRPYLKNNLQYSWIECHRAPDGVEKALFLAFWISVGKLPVCNKQF